MHESRPQRLFELWTYLEPGRARVLSGSGDSFVLEGFPLAVFLLADGKHSMSEMIDLLARTSECTSLEAEKRLLECLQELDQIDVVRKYWND